MRTAIALAALAVGFASPAIAHADDPVAGNWKVTYSISAPTDMIDSIIKLEQTDGKWTASVVAVPGGARPPKIEVKSVSVQDGQIGIAFEKNGAAVDFEGTLGNAKSIRGSYSSASRLFPGTLVWTEESTIAKATFSKDLPEPMKQVTQLSAAVNALRIKAARSKDEDEKKTLNAEAAEKQKEFLAEQPKYFAKVLSDHPDSPAVLDASMNLLRGAASAKSSADDVGKWAAAAVKASEAYGRRFKTETLLDVTEMMIKNRQLDDTALMYARQAEQAMGENGNADRQIRCLTVMSTVLDRQGKSAEAKPLAARIEKLETVLDTEFLAKLPKVDAPPYEGRKSDSKRVVLMELFTGAQCPPCVAADYAFDKLHEAYKPSELILLQYHLHIPMPDPLTNADTVARFGYYQTAYKDKARGTPTTTFSGLFDGYGGGPLTAAGGKLKQYRSIIDPMLEEPAKANLTLTAKRSGDSVTINAAVSDLAETGDKVKLRFALVEDTVRYTGSNGLRFHHMVVRSMPGGPDGFALAEKSSTRQLNVALPEVRSQLTKYLDEFAANRPFPKPQRPMELKKLKVVAFVQDDESHNVLQAAQVDLD